jgi:hypothetical protein
MTAGYGRGPGGARLELGLNAERTISRRRENAEKAAKASAAK